jgi:spore germination cell wall hydrolase CwlJ-like protein
LIADGWASKTLVRFLPADKKRWTLIGITAISLLGAGSALIHHFYLSAPVQAGDPSHSVSITRTPGAADAARTPLAPEAMGLFSKGKQDRADVASAVAPTTTPPAPIAAAAEPEPNPVEPKPIEPKAAEPAEPSPAEPQLAEKPAEPPADGPHFVAASMTPLEMGSLGPSKHASVIGQDVNRGGKGDRLSLPQLTVAKLVAEEEPESAEGVSAALFMMAPHPVAADAGVAMTASAGATLTSAEVAPAPVAKPAPAPKATGWPDLIKLARMGIGDGEDKKPNIFGALSEEEFRAREFRCMATAIYFEARGESIKGQIAVGQVIMTRVNSEYYPKTICGVVYQGQWNRNACQFSFACDGEPDVPKEKEEWETALKVAKDVISGKAYVEEVGDATHYHATYVSPPWRKLVKKVAKVGIHIFYKAPFAPPLIASADFKKL